MRPRAEPLPVDAAVRTAADPLAVRRAALWGLLLAKLIGGWGVQWDIQWHVLIGRDSFWIAPHVMTYAGVTLSVLVSFGVLAWETWRNRVTARGAARMDAVRVVGLAGTPGFHLAAWGIAVTVLAAPVDDLWHRLFGLDVTLWSPPHLMGIFGSAVNALACLVIAREAYSSGSRMRLAAILLGGALLAGTLYLVLQPSFRIAYVHGGVRFFTYPVLAALLLPLALVTAARLSGRRWAPLGLLLVLFPVGIAGGAIARAGFAWLQPVSVIEEEIAKDPTSPIALATAIARKNRTQPGQLGGPGVYALIPAAVMVLVDARRRPVAASLGYAATLFAVSGWLMARLPAFQPVVPSPPEALLALGVTLVAAGLGGLAASRLADALMPSAMENPQTAR